MSSRDIEGFNYGGHGYTVERSEYPDLEQVILEKNLCLLLLRADTILFIYLAYDKNWH